MVSRWDRGATASEEPVNADVDEAHGRLQSVLTLALLASQEHAAAQSAVGVEEGSVWEQIGSLLVPRLGLAELQAAAELVGEPRLPELLHTLDDRRRTLVASRDEIVDAVLDADDFAAISDRRKLVETRLREERARLKELRARPGVAELVDENRGARLREAQAALVRQHDELRRSVDSLEQETTRLAAIAARHHRAQKQLEVVSEAVRLVDEEVLRDARRLVVDRLAEPGARRPATPALTTVFHRLDGVQAKRASLALLYEMWVRVHGAELMALQHEGRTVAGFETVSWPAKVELRTREATEAIDAFRRSVPAIVGFSHYASVVDDWWGTYVPGVAPPPGAPSGRRPNHLPARSDAASPEDKLAAAWASVALSANEETETMAETAWASSPSSVASSSSSSPAGAALFPSGNHLREARIEARLLHGLDGLDPQAPHGGVGAAELDRAFDEPTAYDDDAAWMSAGSTSVNLVAPPGFEHNPFLEPSSSSVKRSPALAVADVVRPTFAPGSRIGRCVVQSLIGKGGMGEVYKARLEGEGGFARAVVLKRLLLDHTTNPEATRSFAREAEIAARIAHPNVVQIYDVQSEGGEPFMIMEFLEGLSLLKLASRARLAGLALDQRVLTRCALDAARGLHAAHSMRNDDGTLVGLVHRDVSPDNLFLCHNGFTKLLDFGIARRSDLTTMTRGNELKGKIPYMSPEQILGDPLDARSDLFSLGSSFYQLLCGERPFTGDNEVTTLYAVVNKPHTPVHARLEDVGVLGDVVEALLRKRRDQRPSSALEVVQLLEAGDAASPEEAAAFLARVWET
jgi:serine/threonine-protein kinase